MLKRPDPVIVGALIDEPFAFDTPETLRDFIARTKELPPTEERNGALARAAESLRTSLRLYGQKK